MQHYHRQRQRFPRRHRRLLPLKALTVFPSIFKGEHIRHIHVVEVLTGQNITVEFDRPAPLQIDGETIPGVSSYRAAAHSQIPAKT